MWLSGRHALVTGGTGQIGSFLVERLLDEGVKVSVLSRGEFPQDFLKEHLDDGGVSHVKCDLGRDDDALALDGLEDVAAVFHLSSIVAPVSAAGSARDRFFAYAHDTIDVNIKGTFNLLRMLPGLEYISFASSIAIYGSPAYLPVDEKCPAEPLGPYGASKVAVEKFLQIHSGDAGVPVSLLRYSSAYGPRNMTSRAVPTFVKRMLGGERPIIYGDGTVVRDYCYVADLVEGTMLAAKGKKGGAYNIGSGEGHDTNEIVRLINDVTGNDVEPIYKEAPKDFDIVFDISKARDELGYLPRWDLKAGLSKEIEWQRSLL